MRRTIVAITDVLQKLTLTNRCEALTVYLSINRILEQMTGFRLLLFVPYSVLEVPPFECSYSGCVFVPDLVKLSQM